LVDASRAADYQSDRNLNLLSAAGRAELEAEVPRQAARRAADPDSLASLSSGAAAMERLREAKAAAAEEPDDPMEIDMDDVRGKGGTRRKKKYTKKKAARSKRKSKKSKSKRKKRTYKKR